MDNHPRIPHSTVADLGSSSSSSSATSTLVQGPWPADAESRPAASSTLLERIAATLRTRTGWDLGGYTPATLARRLARRMEIVGVRSEPEYLAYLERERDEAKALAADLLVPVTRFFRDPDVFEALETVVLPALFDRLDAADPVRVWSVGCASGEEPYSLAMLLHEEAERRGGRRAIRVFATDLHEDSLAHARAGVYPKSIEDHVSADRLARFFHAKENRYHVDRRIRDSVVFAVHDLLVDPPFSHVHLIASRNLLIYLRAPTRRKALELFHYALVPGGDLVLGSAERTDMEELFVASQRREGIYHRRDVGARRPQLAAFSLPGIRAREAGRAPVTSPETMDHGRIHARMILTTAPVSVLLSATDRVVHASPGTDRYLTHPVGRPTSSVHALARHELLSELGALLVSARTRPGLACSRPISVSAGSERHVVVMHAHTAAGAGLEGYVLLTFHEPTAGELEPVASAGRAQDPAELQADVRALELEAERARLTIRALTQTYEAGQEDLEASNFELQSANEELRFTLVELERRKEDLQRANEDLRRLDAENKRKVDELARLSRDLEHFFEATEVATVFLDRRLRILRFTPAVREIFKLQPTDHGRPLSDFSHTLDHEELEADAKAALERLATIEREISDRDGRWYLLRVMPYKSAADTIGGVVITLVDISDRKRADDLVRANQEQLYRTLFGSIGQAFCVVEMVFDPDGNPVDWTFHEVNPAFRVHTGIEDAVGKRMREIAPAHEEYWFRNFGHVARTGEAVRFEAPARALERDFDVHAFRVGGPEAPRVAVLLQDVTDRSRLLQDLRSTATELSDANRRKDEYLAMLGHELRNPLAAISSAAELLHMLDAGDPRLRRARDVLDRQSTHMAKLIDGLLEVSRIARGKLHLDRSTIDLCGVLAAVLEDRVTQLPPRGLRLVRVVTEEPVWVEADPVRMAQVMDNLVGNAIKFTPPGGTITASLGQEGDEAVLRVRDTGVGIRSEMLAHVFEAFQQENQDIARSAGGLGLGLALSKGLVELHGGQIVARSEGREHGAELEVRLPIVAAPPRQAVLEQPRPIVPCRILVVEDNGDAAQMLHDLLEAEGHAVRIAETGTRALACLEDWRVDLVLCDLGLPGMSGLDLARIIRTDETSKHIPLVALTGYGQAEDRTQSAEAGFDEHLVKPVDLEVLDRVIGRLVRKDG